MREVGGRKGIRGKRRMLEMQFHKGRVLDFGRAKLHFDERNLRAPI